MGLLVLPGRIALGPVGELPHFLSALCIAALASLALSSRAAPLISPAAGSDAVLAVRSDTQGELRLQYRVERENRPTEIVKIGLAKDYHYKNSAIGFWIHDYRLHRIFRVQPESGLMNDSIYAEVWYRRAEIENRAAITNVMNK